MQKKGNTKDWFDKNCRKSRQEYRKSLRLHKRYGFNTFKERLKCSEKCYKVTTCMDTSIRNFNQTLKQHMESTRNKNPHEFWKI